MISAAAATVAAVALLLLFSLAALLRGLRGYPLRDALRCPRCHYLMIGAPSLRCPECGHLARDPAELFIRRRQPGVIALALLLALLCAAPLASALLARLGRAGGPRWVLAQELTVAGLTIRALDDTLGYGRRVEIYDAGGELQFALAGGMLGIGADPLAGGPQYGIGDDLTGDGTPDLLISEYTGGAHCCSNYYVLSLHTGGPVELLARIAGWHGGAEFRDLDGDGTPEAVLRDWSFAYWNTSFAGSPAPQVILRWRGERYVADAELMRAFPRTDGDAPLPPNEVEFAMWVQAVRAAFGRESQEIAPEYWGGILDLAYSGEGELAWRFAREAWPCGESEREDFLRELLDHWRTSPYWPELAGSFLTNEAEVGPGRD